MQVLLLNEYVRLTELRPAVALQDLPGTNRDTVSDGAEVARDASYEIPTFHEGDTTIAI